MNDRRLDRARRRAPPPTQQEEEGPQAISTRRQQRGDLPRDPSSSPAPDPVNTLEPPTRQRIA
jgi:hypothetical protein